MKQHDWVYRKHKGKFKILLPSFIPQKSLSFFKWRSKGSMLQFRIQATFDHVKISLYIRIKYWACIGHRRGQEISIVILCIGQDFSKKQSPLYILYKEKRFRN